MIDAAEVGRGRRAATGSMRRIAALAGLLAVTASGARVRASGLQPELSGDTRIRAPFVLAGAGRFIGLGGQEPVRADMGDRLAYYYYDGDAGGVLKLEIAPIRWTADGGPELDPLSR
jgi:hypothetical protein